MKLISKTAQHVISHPLAFAYLALKSFNRNQGLLLAGAVAYYALLSVLPLLLLSALVATRFVSEQELAGILGHYLEWLVPSQSHAVVVDVTTFLQDRIALSAVLIVVLLFFSSLAFSVTERAMAIIFPHRGLIKKRHPLVSAVLPYVLAVALCVAVLVVAGASIVIQELGRESVHLFGRVWSLHGLSGVLLYLMGFFAEALLLSTLYLVLPVGAVRLHHALIGGFIASLLWEGVRHLLFWYFSNVSMASVVYGSLTTAVIALFSMEFGATLFLFGAQVISEYERLEHEYMRLEQLYT